MSFAAGYVFKTSGIACIVVNIRVGVKGTTQINSRIDNYFTYSCQLFCLVLVKHYINLLSRLPACLQVFILMSNLIIKNHVCTRYVSIAGQNIKDQHS